MTESIVQHRIRKSSTSRLSPPAGGHATLSADFAAEAAPGLNHPDIHLSPGPLHVLEAFDGKVVQPESASVVCAGGRGGAKSPVAPVACQYRNKWPLHSRNRATGGYVDACESGTWHLHLTRKSTGETWSKVFKCRSWRHEGACRRWKGSQDFVRIREGLKKHDSWVYMVLTFDRSRSLVSAYRRIVDCWKRFEKRLRRRYGRIEYITLIEQHRDGYPHVNVVIHNPEFCAQAAGEGWKTLRRVWGPIAQACGFGLRFWLEPVRSKAAIAGYYVKLVGEMGKTTQVPVKAPRHFRRLRASRGLLPPVYKDDDVTGVLVLAPVGRCECGKERRHDVCPMPGFTNFSAKNFCDTTIYIYCSDVWKIYVRPEIAMVLGAPIEEKKGAGVP